MKKQFHVQYFERQRKNLESPMYVNNRKYALIPNDNAVTQSLIQGWTYEEYIWRFLDKNCVSLKDKTVIDVGANNGQFTIEFACLVGNEGKVHSFEPQRIIYQQLCGNVFLNGLDNVFAHNAAVGKEAGEVFIESPNYFESVEGVNFGNVSVATTEEGEKVRCVALDDMEFKDVALLKIDVQGFEGNVLAGAVKTIEKHRPFIICEVEHPLLEKFGSSDKELIKQMEGLGYEVRQFDPGIKYVSWNGECLDYVAIPKEVYSEQNWII